MEQKFKSLSIFEFSERFPDNRACMKYLAEQKWQGGFVCPKCGHTNFCRGIHEFDRQCTRCNRLVSPTCGTMFHRLKFPIVKAFWIIYYLSTNKKGMSSCELSRKLSLRQKTCWAFKQKVAHAMKSSGTHPLVGKVEVDETVVGGSEEGVCGRKNGKKKIVVLAIEKRGKGVGRIYGKVIKNSSTKELGGFMKRAIDAEAEIKADKWSGYTPLKQNFKNLTQVCSGKKGRNFPEMHRVIMGFKGWLRGTHGHAEHLQAYVDEYCYRFNRASMKQGIFENLLSKMMLAKPITHKYIYLTYA
jgi:predicted RNA-binding Zn-ribbon protein involved in translation (DUF1610 family)